MNEFVLPAVGRMPGTSRCEINGYTQHVSISTFSSSSMFHLPRSTTELYVISQNPLYLMCYYSTKSSTNNKLGKPSAFSKIIKKLNSPKEPPDT